MRIFGSWEGGQPSISLAQHAREAPPIRMTEADEPHARAAQIQEYFASTEWRPSRARRYLQAERRALMHAAITRLLGTPISELTICDVGCGDGGDLAHWVGLGAAEQRVAGTELSTDRAAAAMTIVPSADIRNVTAFEMPFTDAVFDVTTASLVFSSIRSPIDRRALFSEMLRVTRPGGILLVYDFRVRKPNNRHVVAITDRFVSTLAPLAETWRAGPFLPLLDVALRLPTRLATPVIGALPRTHALWAWRR